jgi:CRISPR system Cascade subunit CasE
MSGLHLSRMSLRKDPAIDALARQILPEAGGDRAHAGHRLVWSAFAGDADRTRDFLFRELMPGKGLSAGRSSFLVLSREAPNAGHPLLDIDTKPFAPDLNRGDRLGFSLRANPTRQSGAKYDGEQTIRKAIRRDVVWDALRAVPEAQRREARPRMIAEEGHRWLNERAAASGFRLLAIGPPDIDDPDADHGLLRIDGYEQLRFARIGRKGRISVLEFDGVLEVTEPLLLLAAIARGFGRARAFGCGLMLIRRM